MYLAIGLLPVLLIVGAVAATAIVGRDSGPLTVSIGQTAQHGGLVGDSDEVAAC